MLKKVLLGFAVLLLLAVGLVGWTVGRPIYELQQSISPSTAPEDYAEQDDSRVQLPTPRGLEPRPFNELKNVYWGELHVHTVESLDAVLFGTIATIEDAYRFAKGEALRSPGGELMQLSRPHGLSGSRFMAQSLGHRKCAPRFVGSESVKTRSRDAGRRGPPPLRH